jgi:hypothetical protein
MVSKPFKVSIIQMSSPVEMFVKYLAILDQKLVCLLSELGEDSPLPENDTLMIQLISSRPPLLNNLRKRILGEDVLDDWTPQEQFLGIIGTGENYAVASR